MINLFILSFSIIFALSMAIGMRKNLFSMYAFFNHFILVITIFYFLFINTKFSIYWLLLVDILIYSGILIYILYLTEKIPIIGKLILITGAIWSKIIRIGLSESDLQNLNFQLDNLKFSLQKEIEKKYKEEINKK